MEYQILNEKIKFNIKKNVGKVLYIVEGEKREINLLGMIFKKVLGYKEVITRSRNGKEKYTYTNKENENSKIVIINSEKSNVASITNTKFIEEQIETIKQYDLEFNYENCAIFYIFDNDRENDEKNIRKLIKMYTNSREPNDMNKFDSIGGMLLLSYPAIETFVISNFEKDMINFNKRFDFENQKLKSYIGSKKYDDYKISIDTLTNAFIEMIRSLKKIDIQQINLDDLKECNSKVFDYELKNSKRYMLSLILISFIDLGIIEFIEER